MSRENFGKPRPDAVATVYGWAHPKTGELLVSIRGLPNPVEGYRRNCPFGQTVTTVESPKIEEQEPAPVAVVEEEPKAVVEKKPRKSRGRVKPNDTQE